MLVALGLAGLAVLLAAGLLAVLRSPIEVRLSAGYPGPPRLGLDLAWGGGLWRLSLPLAGPDAGEEEPPEAPVGEAEPEPDTGDEAASPGPAEAALDRAVDALETRRRARRGARTAVAVIGTEGFPLALVRLLRDLVRAVHVDHVGVRAAFGLGDPARTGQVYGTLQGALAWTHATDGVRVDLEPDFAGEGFRGEARVALEATIGELLAALAVFLLAPPTIRAARNGWREARG